MPTLSFAEQVVEHTVWAISESRNIFCIYKPNELDEFRRAYELHLANLHTAKQPYMDVDWPFAEVCSTAKLPLANDSNWDIVALLPRQLSRSLP